MIGVQADTRREALASIRLAHSVAWAFGGDKQKRDDWHTAQEYAAGMQDHPLQDDPMIPMGGEG